MAWGSEGRGHRVPADVRPVKGQGRATWPTPGGRAERMGEEQARISVWDGGQGGGWRKFSLTESISSVKSKQD